VHEICIIEENHKRREKYICVMHRSLWHFTTQEVAHLKHKFSLLDDDDNEVVWRMHIHHLQAEQQQQHWHQQQQQQQPRKVI